MVVVVGDFLDAAEEFLACGRFLDESALSAVEHVVWDVVVGGARPEYAYLGIDPVEVFPNGIATETGHEEVEQYERDSLPMFLIRQQTFGRVGGGQHDPTFTDQNAADAGEEFRVVVDGQEHTLLGRRGLGGRGRPCTG